MSSYCWIFKNKTHASRFFCGLAIFTLCLLLKTQLWQPVFAQSIIGYSNFSCNGAQAQGNLFSSDVLSATSTSDDGNNTTYNIPAPSPTYSNGALSVTDPTQGTGACSSATAPNMGIFARLLCFFRSTIGQIMSSMYCGFQNVLRGPITAALTLFVVIYGIFVVTGMVDVTVKHVMKVFFKMVLVLLFATHADWGIGIGYRFFMAVAEGGSTMVLSAMNSAAPNGNASLTQPDALLYSVFNMAANGQGMGQLANSQGATQAANGLLSQINLSSYCASTLAPLLFTMLIAVPPVAIFLVVMIIMYIGLYARAVLGYLTALVLITFLFVLSPIFVCFALFSATNKIFERWLQYLITYSLQMVIVFAFLAMLQLVPVGTFFTNTLNMLKEYNGTYRVWYFTIPVDTCGVCDPGTISTSTPSMLTGTGITCPALAQNASLTQGDEKSVPDPAGSATPGAVYPVIPLSNLLQRQDFVSFMLAQIIALWLIGFVMEDFLKKAPAIAKEMGAMPMAISLGSSGMMPQRPGDDMALLNFPGMEAVQASFQGFRKQFTKDPFSVTAWPRRIAGGAMGALDGLLHGSADPDNPDSMALDSQSQEVAVYVNSRQRSYVNAQQKTRSTYADMLKGQTPRSSAMLKEYDDLLASSDSDGDKIKNAFTRLNPAQQNYVLARDNETQVRQDLDNALIKQNQVNDALASTMLGGLVDKGTPDGVSRGPSVLMSDFLGDDAVTEVKHNYEHPDTTPKPKPVKGD